MRWRLQVHPRLPSTSDVCIRAAEAGEPAGLAVLALEQTGGRGTSGRTWRSPPGNLYFSVLLRPTTPVSSMGLWSLLAAVALRNALGPGAIILKWPNDLMLGDGKLAGILLDSVGDSAALQWLVIGFGANLAIAPDVENRRIAALGSLEPEAVARAVMAQLDIWTELGLPAARAAWLQATYPLGTSLRVTRPETEGYFRGLSDDGALLLERADGVQRIFNGEVVAPANIGQ